MKAILTDKSKLDSIRGYMIWGTLKQRWFAKSERGSRFMLNKVLSGIVKCELHTRNIRGAWVILSDGNIIYRKNSQLIEEKL